MSTSTTGKVAILIAVTIFLVLWTIFGYGTLIAAFLATEGAVQICLGVYIVGSIFVFSSSLYVKSLVKR